MNHDSYPHPPTVSVCRERQPQPGARREVSRLLRAGRRVVGGLTLLSVFASGAWSQNPVTLLGRYNPGNQCNDVWGYSAPGGTELAILGTVTGTIYIDVTDPAQPHLVGEIPGAVSTWRDMKTYRHYAYAVNESGGGLQIVDLANPQDPRLVDDLGDDFSSAHNLFIDEGAGVLYAVGSNQGTVIYDLTENPESPRLLTTFSDFYIHDIFARDGLAYAAAIQSAALIILDVSNLPSVVEVGSIQYSGAATHNTWLTEDGRFCLTTDETSGGHIRVFDVQNPSEPIEVGSWANPESPRSSVHNVTVRGGRAYISWYVTGLQILDLTDPAHPVRVGSYDTYPGSSGLYNGAWGVYPFARSGYIYVSDISSGLFVLGHEDNSVHVSGTVVDGASGQPLVGVEVRVPDLRAVETDAAGRFSFRIQEGSYVLEIGIFGYEPFQRRLVLTAKSDLDLDIRMNSLPRGDLGGRLIGSTGAPVLGARVVLEGTPLVVPVDSGGTFSFVDVPAGQYRVLVEGEGIHAFASLVEVVANTTVTLEFPVYPALVLDDMEAAEGWSVGAPGDAATSGLWELGDPHGTGQGTVQPEDDHSANGTVAWVTGNAGPGADVGDDDVDGGPTTLTSPRYDLAGVNDVALVYYRWFTNEAGGNGGVDPFVVSASNDDGATWVELERVLASTPAWERVEIPLAQHLTPTAQTRFRFVATDDAGGSVVEAAIDDLELFVSLGRVTGRVVDQGTGEALAGVSIAFDFSLRTSSSVAVETDAEGRFELLTAPGGLRASVSRFGYHDFSAEFQLGAFDTVDLPVDLVRKPTTSLSGVVLVGGSPIAGAMVRIVDTPLATRTDDEGRFALDAVPIGRYRIVAELANFSGEDREVEVEEATPLALTLQLTPEFATGQATAAPNPFRDSVQLAYLLASPAHVRVSIFDSTGREIRTLIDRGMPVGAHLLSWDGRDDGGRRLPQGMYFQRFAADGRERVQRLIVLR